MKPWQVKRSELLLDRKWLRVHQQHVLLGNGAEIEEFHLIESTDWVAVLALTEEGQVVMVDQYRHGLNETSCELPAGVVDAGETPLEAARRELLEETGYVAEDWLPLLSVATEPSRHTNRAHFFFARSARRVAAPSLDQSEDIALRLMSPRQLLTAIEAGQIQHGLHVAAILMASRRDLIDA